MFRVLKYCATVAAFLPVLWAPPAFAVIGVQSNGNGDIGMAHITFGMQFGNTVAFLNLPGGTATGTFVPSTVLGQLKFLTAAHNVDANNDGVIDSNLPFSFSFGGAPGLNGANATYTVNVQPSQVSIKPEWATSGGSATHDLAVITFNVADFVVVRGGALPQISPVNTVNPQGQASVVAGFGLDGDGTVPLDPNGPIGNANQVDGVIKGGWNIIDFAGVPNPNAPYASPPTISPNSGTVILVDFDGPNGVGSTMPGVGTPAQTALEAGTAAGDSGSALLIDSNNDGIFEVVGVLNGGDNPVQGSQAGQYGDVSQYAPIFTDTNQAFLATQGVYLGVGFQGMTISGNFVVIDVNAILQAAGNPLASQALASQINYLRRHGDSAISIVHTRSRRVSQGLSVLGQQTPADSITGGAVNGGLDTGGPLGIEAYFSGTAASRDGSGAVEGQLGVEAMLGKNFLLGGAVGLTGQTGTVKSTSLTGYAIGTVQQFVLSGGFNWVGHDIRTTYGGSQIALTANQFTVDLGASTNFDVGSVTLSPNLGAAYTSGMTANGSITTAGVTTALPDVKFDEYRFKGGLTASKTLPRDWGVIVPFLGGNIGYRNTTLPNSVTALGSGTVQPFFGLQQNGNSLVLVNLPTTLQLLGVNSTAMTDGAAFYGTLTGGVELKFNDGVSIGLNSAVAYDSLAGAGYSGAITVGFAF